MKNIFKNLLILFTIVVFSSVQCQYYLASGSWDGTVKIWDPEKEWKHVRTIGGIEKYYNFGVYVSFSPNGKYLAVGCEGNRIKILNVKTWKYLQIIDIPKGRITGLIFSRDSKHIIALSGRGGDYGFSVWDSKTGNEVAKLKLGQSLEKGTLARGPGKSIFFGTSNTVFCWDYEKKKFLYKWKRDKLLSLSCFLAFKSPFLYILKSDFHRAPREISEYLLFQFNITRNLPKGTKRMELIDQDFLVARGLALNPKGDSLAIISPRGAKLFDFKKDKEVINLPFIKGFAVAFSPDGKYLANGGMGKNEIQVWKVADLLKKKKPEPFKVLEGHKRHLSALAFSPFPPGKAEYEKQKTTIKPKDEEKRLKFVVEEIS